jgi:predicted nucleotidyltransferase
MQNTNPQKLMTIIAKVLAGFPDVEAAYLFGSWAKGTAGRDSDLDLALVTRRPLGSEKIDILAALTAEGVDNVDLVTLDTDDVVLRFEAVSPNRLVYARADFDHGSYYSRVIREYFDFQPYLDRQRDAMKRRLAGG